MSEKLSIYTAFAYTPIHSERDHHISRIRLVKKAIKTLEHIRSYSGLFDITFDDSTEKVSLQDILQDETGRTTNQLERLGFLYNLGGENQGNLEVKDLLTIDFQQNGQSSYAMNLELQHEVGIDGWYNPDLSFVIPFRITSQYQLHRRNGDRFPKSRLTQQFVPVFMQEMLPEQRAWFNHSVSVLESLPGSLKEPPLRLCLLSDGRIGTITMKINAIVPDS